MQKRMQAGLLFTSIFFTVTVFNSTFILLPLYVLKLGGTEFDAGVQAALFFAVSILLRFYFGPLADRSGRKIPLIIGVGLFAVTSLMLVFTHTLFSVLLVRMFQAVALSAFLSSSVSAVADMAPEGKVGFYMGIYRLVSSLSLLLGPAAAMQVTALRNEQTWFFLCGLMGILALGLLMLVPFPDLIQGRTVAAGNPMIGLLAERRLRPAFAGIGLASLAYGGLLSFAAIHIQQTTSIANPGLYFTVFSLSSLVFTLFSGGLSDRLGRQRVAWPSVMGLGAGVGLLFGLEWGGMGVLIASGLLTGVGFNGGLSVLSAWLVDLTPVNNRASALSIQESIIDFAIGGASFIFGILAGWFSLALVFLTCGLLVGGLAAFFFLGAGTGGKTG